jgi:integrase
VGTVFRKTFTKPRPAEAETFVRKGERLARWKDRRGKIRTALLTIGENGAERILLESPFYVAKYRDGAGVVRVEPTGCRDETAARQVLADLERRAELVRSKVMTAAEAAIGRHQAVPITEHLAVFDAHHRAKGVTKIHREDTRRYLNRLAADCGFGALADLRRDALERWLAQRTAEGMSARTRNAYRNALVSFCNWCIETDRLIINPFDAVPKANEKADPRRQRRAMSENELARLLSVARERPLLDALTVRKGLRKGERYAHVRPEVRERLKQLGRERALIYKTLVLTGLRKSELASLTVSQLCLDDALPYLSLDAADEKNREGNDLPLRDDLAADLRNWLAEKLHRLQEEARRASTPIPVRLPPNTPLFNVPSRLVNILNRDLRLAGIPKRDDRGRTLDVHALRHTFGTLLSKGGVAPRTAQAAMRHSDIKLTMNVYTDPKLLDVRGALDALPALPLQSNPAEGEVVRATGTEDTAARTLAPTLAPNPDIQGQPLSIAGHSGRDDQSNRLAASNCSVKGKGWLSIADNQPSYRGDWIRTSDLLNPILDVAGRKLARASRFTAYKSHTSHILRSGTHRGHKSQGVSCSFLH